MQCWEWDDGIKKKHRLIKNYTPPIQSFTLGYDG